MDNREHLVDVGVRHLLMEQVRHGIDKVDGRLLALQRLLQFLWAQAEAKAVLVAGRAHGLQATRHVLGIAVFAARRHLGATHHRVPGHFRPFDAGLRTHCTVTPVVRRC